MSQYMDRLQETIAANRSTQKRARELNIRAGKSVFQILSQSEWDEKLKGVLAGARCAMEVPDMDALLLPALDEAKVAEILVANPDSIKVLGTDFQVAYASGNNPYISLKKEQVELVKSLPDEGIVLPGGRQVEVRFVYDPYWSSSYYGDTNISSLKSKVAAWMNRSAWDNWGKPTLQLPNLETEMFPAIQEATYGTCQLTGKPLAAFGTVYVYSGWSSKELRTQWYQDQAEAGRAHAEAKAHFTAVVEKAKTDKARLAFWEQVVMPIKSEVEKTRGNFSWGDTLRGKIDALSYVSSSSSLEELNNYKAQAEALLGEIKVELVRREEAKRLAEEEAKHTAERAQEEAEWEEKVQDFITELEPPQGYLLVTADKKLFVNCGKSGKMGRVEVKPALGERIYGVDGITPDSCGKESMWQEVPVGKRISVQDFASSGNLKGHFTFAITEKQLNFEQDDTLFPGAWAIATDDEGFYFYPVIAYKSGKRQLPEATYVVDGEEVATEGPADVSALLAKWGDKKPQKK